MNILFCNWAFITIEQQSSDFIQFDKNMECRNYILLMRMIQQIFIEHIMCTMHRSLEMENDTQFKQRSKYQYIFIDSVFIVATEAPHKIKINILRAIENICNLSLWSVNESFLRIVELPHLNKNVFKTLSINHKSLWWYEIYVQKI